MSSIATKNQTPVPKYLHSVQVKHGRETFRCEK